MLLDYSSCFRIINSIVFIGFYLKYRSMLTVAIYFSSRSIAKSLTVPKVPFNLPMNSIESALLNVRTSPFKFTTNKYFEVSSTLCRGVGEFLETSVSLKGCDLSVSKS